MGVGAIEFPNGEAGIRQMLVCYICCARGTTGAIESEGEGIDGADTEKEALEIFFGQIIMEVVDAQLGTKR